jgi:hypothetical protein
MVDFVVNCDGDCLRGIVHRLLLSRHPLPLIILLATIHPVMIRFGHRSGCHCPIPLLYGSKLSSGDHERWITTAKKAIQDADLAYRAGVTDTRLQGIVAMLSDGGLDTHQGIHYATGALMTAIGIFAKCYEEEVVAILRLRKVATKWMAEKN